MSEAEGSALLYAWLDETRRTLQSGQRAAVLAAFAHEGLPLYLRLAFEEARLWRSFDTLDKLPPLDPTITGILAARFTRLERPDEHSSVFVSHTLGLLRAAKNGLTEDELLTVLARDAMVRAEQRALAPHSPSIDPRLPLPAVLWARLYADLADYLAERDADGTRQLTYYHRQLAEVAEQRYLRLPDNIARHGELARYFEDLPLEISNRSDLRKLSEQPAQEAAGGLVVELERTLSDIDFLERRLAYRGVRHRVGEVQGLSRFLSFLATIPHHLFDCT